MEVFKFDEWAIPPLDPRPVLTCLSCGFEGRDEIESVNLCDYPDGPIVGRGNICISCLDKWLDAQRSGDYRDFV